VLVLSTKVTFGAEPVEATPVTASEKVKV